MSDFCRPSLQELSDGGIPVCSGDGTMLDGPAAPKVAVVNEASVRHFFAGRNPIGRHMALGGVNNTRLDIEIVGVVKDKR
jgi:hypothetical protein